MTPVSISPFALALKKIDEHPQQNRQTKITIEKISPEKKERYSSAYLTIKNGVVYLPSQAKVPGWLGYLIEPIYQSKLNLRDLTEIITKIITTPDKIISREEGDLLFLSGKKGKHPLQIATKSTSWRNLDQTSIGYSIQTINDETKWVLFLHNPEPKKRKLTDQYRLVFPISTPIEELVKIILKDVKKYPQVL